MQRMQNNFTGYILQVKIGNLIKCFICNKGTWILCKLYLQDISVYDKKKWKKNWTRGTM